MIAFNFLVNIRHNEKNLYFLSQVKFISNFYRISLLHLSCVDTWYLIFHIRIVFPFTNIDIFWEIIAPFALNVWMKTILRNKNIPFSLLALNLPVNYSLHCFSFANKNLQMFAKLFCLHLIFRRVRRPSLLQLR